MQLSSQMSNRIYLGECSGVISDRTQPNDAQNDPLTMSYPLYHHLITDFEAKSRHTGGHSL